MQMFDMFSQENFKGPHLYVCDPEWGPDHNFVNRCPRTPGWDQGLKAKFLGIEKHPVSPKVLCTD